MKPGLVHVETQCVSTANLTSNYGLNLMNTAFFGVGLVFTVATAHRCSVAVVLDHGRVFCHRLSTVACQFVDSHFDEINLLLNNTKATSDQNECLSLVPIPKS